MMPKDDGLSRTPAKVLSLKTGKPVSPFANPTRLSDIVPRKIEWTWEEWIPRGALSLVTGDPGAGKSTFICELLAAVSVGRLLPGECGPKCAEYTWYLSGEDDAGAIVHWRITNQDGDPTRILITDTVSPTDAHAVKVIGETVRREGINLVVVDLTTTWLHFEEMNHANKIADALTPLVSMARETRCAVVLLRHARKDVGGKEIHRGVGSVGLTGTARAEILVSKTKDGQCFLKLIKGNYSGRVGDAYAFRVEPSPDADNRQSVFVWEGPLCDPVTGKPNAPQTPISKTPAKLGAALAFLRAFLADGPRDAMDVLKEGAALELSRNTLNRAKRELGVVAEQVGRKWVWALPPPSDAQG